MAIIYTYPEKSNIDGSELLLISDGTDENNTKVISTAEYGAYIEATYGGGSGTSIYKADGSIIGNRQLSGFFGGSNYSLTLTNLSQFTVNTIAGGDIRLNPGSGGKLDIDGGDISFTDTNGIKNSTNPTTSKIYWNTDLFVESARAMEFICNNAGGYTQFTNGTSGLFSIVNGLVVLSGVGNDISDITGSAFGKTITTREWTEDYVANSTGGTNIDTVGTITTGTWNADEIGLTYGGTGRSGDDPSYVDGDILFYDASSPTKLTKLAIGNTGEVLTVSGGSPSWQPISGSSLTNVTTTYTVLSTDETVNCTSASGFTVNLTTAVGETGRKIIIKNSGTGDILVDADAAETIDGALTATLVQYESITVQSDGANWIII